MTIQSYKMGPGTLTLDPTGADPAIEFAAQMTETAVTPAEQVTTTPATPTLSGESLPGTTTVTITWTLNGVLIQDLSAAGIADWTWEHAGEEVPFVFTPNTALGREVTGVVRVAPTTVGGAVAGPRPTAPIAWGIVGTPVLT